MPYLLLLLIFRVLRECNIYNVTVRGILNLQIFVSHTFLVYLNLVLFH